MKMRTFIGLCAALAFAAGSTAVHAVKIVEDAGEDPEVNGVASVTYAKESLETGAVTKVKDESGKTTTYYNIDEALILSAPAEVSANAGDSFVVSYTLEGMVFSAVPTVNVANNKQEGQPRLTGALSIASNGAVGDNSVVFRASSASAHYTTADIELNARFAISGAGSGTVTRVVRNLALEGLGIDSSKTRTALGIVKAEPALNETSMAMNPTADVAESFRKFLNGMSVATVGSLMVGVKADHRLAQETSNGSTQGNAGVAVTNVDQLMKTGTTGTPGVLESSVSFIGDFSFASGVYLHGDTDCGVPTAANAGVSAGADTQLASAESQLLMVDSDDMVTGVRKVNVTEFGTTQYLCIMVDSSDKDGLRIKETVPYTPMGTYGKLDAGAIAPMSMMDPLGMIMRNGTTVRFPFLTSQARYNQVLRVTNRGTDSMYTFSSDVLDEDIDDTLLGGDVTTQWLVSDLIGKGVGGASGTLIIEAQPHTIDVAIVHVNRGDGSTDTVIYE